MSDKKMVDYYQNHCRECERLLNDQSRIELIRTQEIIQRYLPTSPSRILDVGGAAGIYSAWLAKLGHSVRLVDVVPLHIKQAKAASAGQPEHPFEVSLGDARNLGGKDELYDAVLLLGPLYHLIEREERLVTLSEAYRVLRKGGFLFAAAISRFASLIDGLHKEMLDDPSYKEIVEEGLRSGRHLPEDPKYFTTAFFHHPDELADELKESDFDIIGLFAVEGPAWLLSDVAKRCKSKERRDQLLYSIRSIEQEPSVLGISAHLLAVSCKK